MPSSEEVIRITDPGVTWLAQPEKLGDLDLFNLDPAGYSSDAINYYKAADLVDGGEIIHATVSQMGTTIYRFKKNTNGKYALLANNSEYLPSDIKSLLNNEKYNSELLYVDRTTQYNSIAPANILIFQEIKFKKNSTGILPQRFFDSLVENYETSKKTDPDIEQSLEKIGATAYGDFYKLSSQSSPDNNKLKKISYFIKLADTSIAYYSTEKDFLADDGTLVASLNSNGQIFKSRTFNASMTRGVCGLDIRDEIYTDPTLSSRLTTIGTTPSGKNLYTLASANDEILKSAYEIYKVGRGNEFDIGTFLTYDAFAAKKPVLVWQYPFGNYLLLLDKDYGPMAECGKPVIYLYPEKTTAVSVKVGAKIRISEPLYNSGWQVTANPNGSIFNQDGQIYDSLYWEGKGYGLYPDIRTGRVVSGKNIEAELRHDLAALGLNAKESGDFMDFWLPKMPQTPYVRLTWLNTEEMNYLAPLDIFPRPDTIARIFLDFQGQNTPDTNLKPQKLESFKRQGFTVVEWGGLLINGE